MQARSTSPSWRAGRARFCCASQGDAVLDAIITELLAIVAKVTTFEQAMAN